MTDWFWLLYIPFIPAAILLGCLLAVTIFWLMTVPTMIVLSLIPGPIGRWADDFLTKHTP